MLYWKPRIGSSTSAGKMNTISRIAAVRQRLMKSIFVLCRMRSIRCSAIGLHANAEAR